MLYFGTTNTISVPAAYESLRALFPAALIAGCSAGSRILAADVQHDALIAVTIRFDRSCVRGALEPIADASQSRSAGIRLAQQLQSNEGVALQILHELRALGVGIVMDDFGTGYSSLAYLHTFPFDGVKIDRSFINGLGHKADAMAIVRTVTG